MYTVSFLFFFNDPATTEIYTLSLHDALPIYGQCGQEVTRGQEADEVVGAAHDGKEADAAVDEEPRGLTDGGLGEIGEHTSELQSLAYLVCRLLLEKKKKKTDHDTHPANYIIT